MRLLNNSAFMALGLILFFNSLSLAGEPATVLKGDVLKAEPFNDARTTATLAKGDKVDIQKRQGGWLYVASPKGKGWVRMLSIKKGASSQAGAGKEASSVLDVASGRAGTGKVVATTGIRGLNEEELKTAQFNGEELKKMESYTVPKRDAELFAKKGKLFRQNVPLLSEPSASSERGGDQP